jgi:hypothetical protein
MFPGWLRSGSIAIVAATLSSLHAFGSKPSEDPLLRLVPANAQMVAGIEDPHHNDQSGRLLIVTHNDNADLRDWITLAGVDDHQQVDRLIEVAASSERGELSEHLLLARGSFNGRHILLAAESYGGIRSDYKGLRIVILKPFAREEQEMRDTRWLAMLDDNTAVFGSPAMVKSALDRYAASSAVDPALAKSVSELAPDVNCWSLLMMPVQMMITHVLPGVLEKTTAALMRQVTTVSLSIRYGSKERVDFVLGTENPDAATTVATAIQGTAHLLPATNALHARMQDVSVRGSEVRGSVRVAGKEFDPWLVGLYTRGQATPGGENVAQVGDGR